VGAILPEAPAERRPDSNRVLDALPQKSLLRLQRHLHPTELRPFELIHAAGAIGEHVYFIDRGLVSLVKTMSGGDVVEVGTIGIEGVVGLGFALGLRRAVVDAVVQLPGVARRIAAATLREEMAQVDALRHLLLGYTEAALDQLAQTAACNRLHSLEERCSRWLLVAHDNAGSDRFHITHERLALLLGVQRPGLSITAHGLQDAGLIHYHNGEMEILDRAGLEARACECYRTVQARFDQLPGPTSR